MEDYRTVRGTAIGEYEEKKSRFIAQLSFADSEEKAVAFLEQVRAANRTARHNVYAYRLREGNRERYSDDGEPAKTAGTPALADARRHRAAFAGTAPGADAGRSAGARFKAVLRTLLRGGRQQLDRNAKGSPVRGAGTRSVTERFIFWNDSDFPPSTGPFC